ncbi:MAG TPA: molybdate ABC transporter substrate-binding protein [Candidatus Acidoferrales bacterium]|nr:molybdate ABC transporter substrate-binding protein [Candidatus Acidoferrales bacterium]
MPNRRTALFVSLVLLLTAPFVARVDAQQPQITVAAAISMKDALDALEKRFSERAGAPKVTFSLGASGILQKQIEEGAPVDAFISAAPAQMNALEEKGLLLAGTRRDIAGNRLVLVVPAGSTAVKTLEDLKRPEVQHIAIGEIRSVPAGQYAAEALRNLNLFDALQAKFVYAQNVRAVLTYVSGRDADAGFVYETDAKSTDKVTIAMPLPASSYSPVVYPAAVIRNSQNAAAAKSFLEFLSSPEGRAIFERLGFTTPSK